MNAVARAVEVAWLMKKIMKIGYLSEQLKENH